MYLTTKGIEASKGKREVSGQHHLTRREKRAQYSKSKKNKNWDQSKKEPQNGEQEEEGAVVSVVSNDVVREDAVSSVEKAS